jgi:putative radical SAM enzyme (TIGR03279 family)
MRSSIYFKDEDYRFSWLYGNYVTLFNMSEEDLAKAVARRMSPMYVSVHATDEAVRGPLLGVKKDTQLMPRLRRLAAADIQLHCQVVVVPGRNDGAVLERTVRDLAGLHPAVASVALVPVGLTRHRQHLPILRLNTRAEARALLSQVGAWQAEFSRGLGTRLVFAADEWYLKAGLALPGREEYEDFPQLGNGVGSVRGFLDAFNRRLGRAKRRPGAPRRVLAVTGAAFAPTLQRCARALQAKLGGLELKVLGVENRFYGRSVSVAGLLCGADLAAGLRHAKADRVLLPDVMLRDREGLFLDNTSLAWLEQQIKSPVQVVPADAPGFLKGCCQ